jgi:uncharacterized protein YcaQ
VASLTLVEARRVALAAQGFTDRRPAPFRATSAHLQRVLDRVGVVQIDSVNVLSRSQYLPFYSRLGPYDTALLDRARDRAPRRVVEYWAHEASLVAPTTWPLLDFRMRRALADSWGGMLRTARDHPEVVEAVREVVRARGPLTAREVETALEHQRVGDRSEWGWNWSVAKRALELLFWAGEVTSAGRTSQFERRYAALDVVAPRDPQQRALWLDPAARLDPAEAIVELVRIAAKAVGVGTARCLGDYFRLRPEQAGPAIAALVARGELVEVDVVGWRRTAYLWHEASIPRTVRARALVSPFDSVVWERRRTAELFGFDYRLEIYVPAAKRVHGYYVLPFLLGDALVGRVDLKADRTGSVLLVQSASLEPGAPRRAAAELLAELRQMADWLQLTDLAGPGLAGLR